MIKLKVSDTMYVKPDELNISIGVDILETDRTSALKRGVEVLDNVVNTLSKFTDNINIGNKYTRVYKTQVADKQGGITSYKYVKDGYVFNSTVFVKFSSSFKDIDNLFCTLENLEECCTVNVSYSISDEENYKDILLTKLVRTAKDKAEILAKASGRRLGKIIEITNTSERHYSYESDSCLRMCDSVSYEKAISTDLARPQAVSNSITVSFELLN